MHLAVVQSLHVTFFQIVQTSAFSVVKLSLNFNEAITRGVFRTQLNIHSLDPSAPHFLSWGECIKARLEIGNRV